jgi:hypothetical protein
MVYRTRTLNKDNRRVRGAIKTFYGGYWYPSQHEATVARDLDFRKMAGEIKGWERQFKVEMWACNSKGERVLRKNHKIDFRAHELDGTFTLIEAKGFETQDYKERRAWLDALWLPEHPDHSYVVYYNEKRNYRRSAKILPRRG